MINRTSAAVLHLALCSTFSAFPAPEPLAAQEVDERLAPVIRTSGVGEVTLEPDLAVLAFGIQLHGPSSDELLAEVASIQAAVVDALSAFGVPADSLEVDQLQARPRWSGEGPDRRRDYYVSAAIRFRTDEPARVPDLIEAALAAGVSQSSGVRWESSRADDARAEALALALAAARRDAEALAEAAGGRLGELVEVSTTGGPTVRGFAMEAAEFDSAARAAVGPTPQPVVVRQSVVASWRLEVP